MLSHIAGEMILVASNAVTPCGVVFVVVIFGVEQLLGLSDSGVELDPVASCFVSRMFQMNSTLSRTCRISMPASLNARLCKPVCYSLCSFLRGGKNVGDLFGRPVLA